MFLFFFCKVSVFDNALSLEDLKNIIEEYLSRA